MLWPFINESAPVVHISHKRIQQMPASIWPLVEGKDQQNRKSGPGAIKTVQAGDWHDFINGDSSPDLLTLARDTGSSLRGTARELIRHSGLSSPSSSLPARPCWTAP
jgi:hypothetical protein